MSDEPQMAGTTEAQIGRERIDAALSDPAFAPFRSSGVVLAAAGLPVRIIHASPAAQSLFGAASLEALTSRCLQGEEPGARRLSDLASNLRPGGPARLERLRFTVNGKSAALIFLCRRLPAGAQDGGPLFIAAADAASLTAAAAPPQAQQAFESPTFEVQGVNQASPAIAPGSVRFVWRTDASHRFTMIDDRLTPALGWRAEQLIGMSFLEIAARANFDPQARLREALARHKTWSGIEALWPHSGNAFAAPVTLGAIPLFARDRRFDGFSGFGVVHLTRAQARPAAAETLSEPIADEAPEPISEGALLEEIDETILPEIPGAEEEAASEPARHKFLAPNVVALDAWKGAAAASQDKAEPEDAETPISARMGQPYAGYDDSIELSPSEKLAFREIARALGAVRKDEGANDKTRKIEDRGSQQQSLAPQENASGHEPQAPEARYVPEAKRLPEAKQVSGARQNLDLAALVDRIDAGLLVCQSGEAVYLNRALLEALGYGSLVEFISAGGMAQMFESRRPGGPNAQGESDAACVTTADGRTLTLDARLKTIDWEGAPATLMTFSSAGESGANEARLGAATRLRALEIDSRAFQAEIQELRSILDTATDGVVVLDDAGAILSLNASAEALFGFERHEVTGQNFITLFARESQPAAEDYLAGLKTNGVRSVLNDGREVVGRARQGGHIPVFMTLGRIGAPEDQRFCAVLRDLTQWKNAERELKEARREAERVSALKSDFLAKISHEVRTPLNAIIGFAEVMMEEQLGPLGNERYRDYLKDIHSSGGHVMSLVNDLLDLSKIEAGRLDLSFSSVDANRIISECVSIMQPQAQRERVILRLSLAAKLPNLVADERSLRQIVLNILSNAVKFNQPGGQVIVSTALTETGDAVLRVRDTGIGMSEREVETALEPFRQIQTSRQTTGTGLGLPLTKAMVEANRAAFVIRSRKGEGTLVEVSFPATRVLAE